MRGLNKVILIGNLGKDPEVSRVSNDMKRAAFSLATTESYKDKNGQKVDATEWHNIVVWGKLAEVAEQYLKKGSPIYMEGKIVNRSYDDKDGNKKYITEIRCDNFIMLGGKKDEDPSEETNHVHQPASSPDPVPPTSVSDDDLPF